MLLHYVILLLLKVVTVLKFHEILTVSISLHIHVHVLAVPACLILHLIHDDLLLLVLNVIVGARKCIHVEAIALLLLLVVSRLHLLLPFVHHGH